MIPKRIEGSTHYLGAPQGWKVGDPPCAHLAVRESKIGDLFVYDSAWEPTPGEIELLSMGGTVVLRVVGAQPPVMLWVEAAPLVDNGG